MASSGRWKWKLTSWAVGVAFVGGAVWSSRPLTKPAAEERRAVAARYAFEKQALPSPAMPAETRPVFAEAFSRVEYYLSGFAPAGAALADLDGNGLSDEACTTDIFQMRATVHPVPGGRSTFEPFHLDLAAAGRGTPAARPSGCLPGDFNEDGRTDLLVYFWGGTPVVFLRTGDARLTASSYRAVPLLPADRAAERWYTQAMLQSDIDGDGRLDLVVANYFPDDGAILSGTTSGPSEMNDGWAGANNGARNRLLLASAPQAGQPRFVEVADAFGDDLGGTQWTIGVGAADLDGDHKPEIVFINDHGPDRFLRNKSEPGQPRFEMVISDRRFWVPKSKTLGRDDFHGMGIDFVDLNRDGRLDWIVSNWSADFVFQQAHFAWIATGDARWPFEDRAEEMGFARSAGVPWDIRAADFDNDGVHEIVQTTGFMRGGVNRVPELHELALFNDQVLRFPFLWHRFGEDDDISGQSHHSFHAPDAKGRLVDVGPELGMKEDEVSRGLVVADVDGDGRLDMLVASQRSAPVLYRNQTKSDASYLALTLRLPYDASRPDEITVLPGAVGGASLSAGRVAVGAQVVVSLPNGAKVTGHVDGGSGFAGRPDGSLHFGLGATPPTAPLDVAVSWRDRAGEVRSRKLALAPGRHTLVLGSSTETSEVRP